MGEPSIIALKPEEIQQGKLRYSDLVFTLVLVYLIVDSINGFLLRQGVLSISMPYKIMLLTLIVIMCRSYQLILSSIAVILFYLIFHFVRYGDWGQAVAGVDWLMKFLSIPVFLVYFCRVLKYDSTGAKIFLFARFCFAVLAVNIGLGALGIGYAVYSSAAGITLGAQGFIFAGNELGLALILSGALVMQNLLQRNQFVRFLLFSMAFVILAGLTALKSAVVGALLLFILFPCVTFATRLRGAVVPRRVLMFSSLVLFASPIVVVASGYFVLYYVGLWDRIAYFLGQNAWLTVLLSERNLRAVVALQIFVHDYDSLQQLFGSGTAWMADYRVNANVEIDSFDFLMRYGLVGVALAYVFVLSVLFLSVNAAKRDRSRLYSVNVQVIVLLASVMVGHVLYSATSAPLMGAVMAMAVVGTKRSRYCIERMFHANPSIGSLVSIGAIRWGR